MSNAQVDADPVPELTSGEACTELDIDRSTLTRWVKSGRLNPTRQLPGKTGAFLFSAAEIATVKAQRSQEQAS